MNSDSLTGQKLGAFEVLQRIGRGGMAEVYKAWQPSLHRYVAIKVMGLHLGQDPELTQRFRREARTIASLRHPNIIQVHDFGVYEGGHYLVMEYVDGSDLRTEIDWRKAENRPFSPDEALNLLAQVAGALDYAHSQGVIHRDVKPGNILLRDDGQAILSDFGLAMLRDRISQATSGHTFGTPEYIAPEQAMDSRAAGPRSDIYALGGVVYEMLTGHLLFDAESALSMALKHVSEIPVSPRRYAPGLPQGVEDAILKAVAKDPADRFPTAKAFVDELQSSWAVDLTTRIVQPTPLEDDPWMATPAPPPKRSAAAGAAEAEEKDRRPARGGGDRPGPSSQVAAAADPVSPAADAPAPHPSEDEALEVSRSGDDVLPGDASPPDIATPDTASAGLLSGWPFWVGAGAVIVTVIILLLARPGGGLRALLSPTETPTPTPTSTSTTTPMPTPTLTPTATTTPTSSPSPTADVAVAAPSLTPSSTVTRTPTPTPTPTSTPSPTATFTPSPTPTPTLAPGDTVTRTVDGMMLRFVPGGAFLMGAPEDATEAGKDEQPQHEVLLSPYWIDATEVTIDQYKLCVAEDVCEAPYTRTTYDDPTKDDHPITYISWDQAVAYCAWVAEKSGWDVRLPTEAEWEKAAGWDPARQTHLRYPWGEELDEDLVHLGNRSAPVGSYPDGASPYGALDMSGNVWEWVYDWYDKDYYDKGDMPPDPTGPDSGRYRVMRGGAYDSTSNFNRQLRTTHREVGLPEGRAARAAKGPNLGFRCAVSGERLP